MIETAQHHKLNILGEIWKRNQLLVLDRVAILEQAAKAAAQHTLQPALRDEAASIAHKLAGSLGMFGFAEGTKIAREIEHLLEAKTPPLHAAFDPLTGPIPDALVEAYTDQFSPHFTDTFTDLTGRLRQCLPTLA